MLPRFGTHRENSSRSPSAPVPKTVILCDQGRFFKQVLEQMPHIQCEGCSSKLYFLTHNPGVAIGDFGVSASSAAAKMEELIAWGVQQFISIAVAGSLQTKATTGDIVICEKAVRDETTSRRYLPPTKYVHAPRRMMTKLLSELKKSEVPCLIGGTWTIDNLYDMSDALQYQKEGILTVETQAAALFAVAHFYQVDLGAMFAISDSHEKLLWESTSEDERTLRGLHTLLHIALAAVKEQRLLEK